MLFRIITLLLFLLLQVMSSSGANNWIRLGYWYARTPYVSIPDIDSTLFTHLACSFARINSSTSQVYVPPAFISYFSNFTPTVRRKNPSVITILSISCGNAVSSNLCSLVSQPSRRNAFIQSSITLTRRFGFQGIHLSAGEASSIVTNTTDLGTLLDEWRAAINSESKNSGQSRLILTVSGYYLPVIHSTSYPVDSMTRNVDWLNIVAYKYHLPENDKFTGAHAALYDPRSNISTDYGVKQWIAKGFPASKIVLGLSYFGYVWKLADPKDNAIGAPASGPGKTEGGGMPYSYIMTSAKTDRDISEYNATYVVNYFTQGSLWFCFDGVEAIKTKVAYAKEKKLRGYSVFQIPWDDHWILSKAAYEEHKEQRLKKLLLVVFLSLVGLTLLLGAPTVYLQRRMLRMKVMRILTRGRKLSSPDLKAFSFADLKAATNKFSSKNKLGEGGFGPVYKGNLPDGLEIAVKRLSKASHQGAEEFINEVTLTAKLQHVNLVRLLGFCTEGEEKLLIYEYMPNKSLAFYIHDPVRRMLFDWSKWVQVIEGVIQGLIYLQEYSRWTIIHRDIKASNILLDNKMKPKISDFGLARIFHKDDEEANTSRIMGTYGYAPPEYVREGIYSTKYDIYSFGVLLLQIISGKNNACVYGPKEDLNLLEYAYELWKDGKGMEFVDPLLDDSLSSCKIMRCMQVALLCVQEKWQDRPSMLEVSSMLKNESEAVPTPKINAFWKKKDNDAIAQQQLEICSVDVEPITQLDPR